MDLDWTSLASPETTLVVYMGISNIAEISMRLIAEGMAADMPVMAIASATTPREIRVIGTLTNIATQVEEMALEAPVLFIIGRVVALYDGIATARAMACEGPGMAAYA